MPSNTPIPSPTPLIPSVESWLEDVNTRFAPPRYGKIDDADFRAVFAGVATVFADWRKLSVKRVKGATYPVPYTDNLGLVPADYRIVGMQAEAVYGVDSATGAAGVRDKPVYFMLLRDSTGEVDALLDTEATLTVKARWVQTSGTEEEKIFAVPELVLEDQDYDAGDVRRYTFDTGETRLVQWINDSVGFSHPVPTGQDSDPIYRNFAPLSSEPGVSLEYVDAADAALKEYVIQVDNELGGGIADLDTRTRRLEAGGYAWQAVGAVGSNQLSRGGDGFIITRGANNYDNTFDAKHSFNTYGANNFSNTFGYDHSGNSYANDHDNNIYGNRHQSNVYGKGHFYNRFGHGHYNNTYGANMRQCTIGDNVQWLQMGANCLRVEVYDTVATAAAPFIIPAGTTDKVYRRGAEVVAGGAGVPLTGTAQNAPVTGDVHFSGSAAVRFEKGYINNYPDGLRLEGQGGAIVFLGPNGLLLSDNLPLVLGNGIRQIALTTDDDGNLLVDGAPISGDGSSPSAALTYLKVQSHATNFTAVARGTAALLALRSVITDMHPAGQDIHDEANGFFDPPVAGLYQANFSVSLQGGDVPAGTSYYLALVNAPDVNDYIEYQWFQAGGDAADGRLATEFFLTTHQKVAASLYVGGSGNVNIRARCSFRLVAAA